MDVEVVIVLMIPFPLSFSFPISFPFQFPAISGTCSCLSDIFALTVTVKHPIPRFGGDFLRMGQGLVVGGLMVMMLMRSRGGDDSRTGGLSVAVGVMGSRG